MATEKKQFSVEINIKGKEKKICYFDYLRDAMNLMQELGLKMKKGDNACIYFTQDLNKPSDKKLIEYRGGYNARHS